MSQGTSPPPKKESIERTQYEGRQCNTERGTMLMEYIEEVKGDQVCDRDSYKREMIHIERTLKGKDTIAWVLARGPML